MNALIDHAAFSECLKSIGLEHWPAVIAPIIDSRLSKKGHGDFLRWRQVLNEIEQVRDDSDALKDLLHQLAPWRKGPFDIAEVRIDAEWRSDLKWGRIKNAIAPLSGRNVLDVGCGNGYYALQSRKAGAQTVIGVDPTLLFVVQFLAVNTFERESNVFILPLRLNELPLPAKRFDTTFSMGVLYHQRAPVDHLVQLRKTLKSGGQLVLETIYLPGDEPRAVTPPDRYARMRNVWLVPTLPELLTWLQRTGYQDINIVDRSITTIEEQRSTEWMTFESLREALNPDDASLTIEGWPAPHRIVLTATSS